MFIKTGKGKRKKSGGGVRSGAGVCGGVGGGVGGDSLFF